MSQTLEIIGAVGGIIGVGVAIWAVTVARKANTISERATTTSQTANTLAGEANEISKSAASSAESAAQAAARSAHALETRVELERAARGAQLFVVSLRNWVEGTSPAASSILVKFGNSGGSLARDLTITEATIENATYLIPREAIDVPQGTEGEVSMLLPIPPRDGPWPPFVLTIRYTDANGPQSETLLPFQGQPNGARVINLNELDG